MPLSEELFVRQVGNPELGVFISHTHISNPKSHVVLASGSPQTLGLSLESSEGHNAGAEGIVSEIKQRLR